MSNVKRFYSASTRGFHVQEVIPEDAVEITHEQWQALLEAQSSGKQIVPDAGGKPIAVDFQVTPEIQINGQTRTRDQLLSETDWLVARHRDELEAEQPTTLSADTYKALQKWRADLRALTRHPDFLTVEFPPRPEGI